MAETPEDDLWRQLREAKEKARAADPEGYDRRMRERRAVYLAPVEMVQTETGWLAQKAGMVGVGATKSEALEDVWRKVQLQQRHWPKD